MSFPKPPNTDDKPSGAVTLDETQHILKQTLLPEHHGDPNVLRFISSYMRCRDVRQAAREAGLHPNSGTVLRSRPDIHSAITALTTKSMMKYGFDAAEVIEKVKEIAGIDLIEFQNEDGTYKKSLNDVSPEARRAIKKLKVRNTYETDPNGMKIYTGEIIEIEVWDKMKAVELLGREKEIFKETKKVEHDITGNMKDLLLDSRRRADARHEKLIDVGPTTPHRQIAAPVPPPIEVEEDDGEELLD